MMHRKMEVMVIPQANYISYNPFIRNSIMDKKNKQSCEQLTSLSQMQNTIH